MEGANPICRVCLNTSLEYIHFETPINGDNVASDKKYTYLDCFQDCTQIEIHHSNNENFNTFCDSCGIQLKNIYEFLQKAKKSDKIIKQILQSNKNVECAEQMQQLCTKLQSAYEEDEIDVVERTEIKLQIECEIQNKEDLCNEFVKCEELTVGSSYACITDVDKNVLYACSYCDKFLYSHCALNEHLEKEHANKLKKAHKSNDDSEDHNVDESCALLPKNYFTCKVCQIYFETRSAMMQHIWEIHKQKTDNKCKICDQEIPKNVSIRQHEQIEHVNIIKCDQCDYVCKEYKMLKHVNEAHGGVKNYMCHICSKSYRSAGVLNAHLKYHQRKELDTKSDACKICGKKFSTQHYLRLHMEVHKNEREIHECYQCKKQYISKTALESHMKIHRGETIECTVCKKPFSRQYELNVHMRFHTREYPFSCEICGKQFAIKGHLRTHMWRHQGLKLQCAQCFKLFTSTKALNEHSYTHTAMPFPCSYCPKAYPSRQKFKIHLKTAHLKDLDTHELEKFTTNQEPKPLLRKNPTLVQAYNFVKEVEVTTINDEPNIN